MKIPILVAPALAVLLNGCVMARGLQEGFPAAFSVHHGQAVARKVCAACHAVDQGQSSLPGAPTLSQVSKKYSDSGLRLEMETITEIGHYSMPAVRISSKDQRDLVAYIASLRGNSDR
jgi:mono/diheme cytochrome c family protein